MSKSDKNNKDASQDSEWVEVKNSDDEWVNVEKSDVKKEADYKPESSITVSYAEAAKKGEKSQGK